MITGVFTDTDGVLHQFYEIDVKGYYRIDICKQGTSFQTDPNGVEYSKVKKKFAFVYGDNKLYNEYLMLKDLIASTKGDEVRETKWEEGKYYIIITRENKSIDYHSRVVILNGSVSNCEAYFKGQLFQYMSQSDMVAKLDPLNFGEYVKQEIDAGYVDDAEYATPYYPYEVIIRRFDLKHLLTMDLVVADSEEVAEQRLKEWVESDAEIKGFDTETTGLDMWLHGQDVMVGIILSISDKSATYFPFRMKKMHNLSREFLDRLMQECIKQQDKLVAHFKKFDRKVMLREGYDLRIRWCTQIISFMLNPVVEAGAHALKPLITKITGDYYLELSDIYISGNSIDFSVLEKRLVGLYACPDSINACKLFKVLKPQVPLNMWPIIYIELALADLKAEQEYYGMRIDVKKYMNNYKNCNYVLDTLLTIFRKMTHEDGNIDSSDVLSVLLYDKLGCKVLMRTKTGRRSTSSKAIDKLASLKAQTPFNITEDIVDLNGNVVIKASKLANSKYPALVVLSKYKEYNKRKTAFYARFEKTVTSGRIGFWINQNGASSGRQSSPMHQLPPELKDIILSDGDEYDLWGPDYSQIELRMIAFLAKEKDLIEMCKDPDNDIHRVCASLITGKRMWEITKEERYIKKRVNFGVIYLISEYGLAGQLDGPGYTKERVEYCREQLDAFYDRFKRINLYLKKNALKVQTNGYMKTLFNRIKYFKEIFDPDITERRRASIIRQANNLPVQGSAADLMKIAEVNMYTWIHNKGWDKLGENGMPMVRVMLSIHDEVLISAHRSIPMEEIIEMIATCMEIKVEDAPPFFVAPAKMTNWGGHSDDSLSIPVRYRDKLIADYKESGKTAFKRSYFRVDLPTDKKTELNAEHVNNSSLVKKYQQFATFTFEGGDYGETLNEVEKIEAFTQYITSKEEIYVKENYKKLLDDYRSGIIRDYMLGLVRVFGNDPAEVAKHVTHPSLTHELLDLYPKQLKAADVSHVEQIALATKMYLEGFSEEDIAQPEVEQKEVQNNFEQFDNIYNFDKDGNVIFEYEEPEDGEGEDISKEESIAILRIAEDKAYRVWSMVDKMVIDVDGLTMSDIDKVLAEVWKYKDEHGFYEVYLSMSNKLVSARFHVEELDKEAITDLILKLEKEVVSA